MEIKKNLIPSNSGASLATMTDSHLYTQALKPFNNTQRSVITAQNLSKTVEKAEDKEVKQVLAFCMSLIGCKVPDETQTFVLMKYIREKLSAFYLEDIRQAFYMLVSHELTLPYQIFPSQVFSALLLADVMTAYKEYKGKVMVEFQAEIKRQKQQAEQEKNKKTPEQEFESLINTAVGRYIKYVNNGEIDDLGDVSYKFFNQLGFINITDEDRISITDSTITEMKKDATGRHGGKKIIDFINQFLEGKEVFEVSKEIRKNILKRLFDDFKNLDMTDNDIKELLIEKKHLYYEHGK